jgi:hypothetical protein
MLRSTSLSRCSSPFTGFHRSSWKPTATSMRSRARILGSALRRLLAADVTPTNPCMEIWPSRRGASPAACSHTRRRIAYTTVARLLSYRELRRIVRRLGSVSRSCPSRTKYLNPLSARGIRVKRMIAHAPLRWLSMPAGFVQPALDALFVKAANAPGSC